MLSQWSFQIKGSLPTEDTFRTTSLQRTRMCPVSLDDNLPTVTMIECLYWCCSQISSDPFKCDGMVHGYSAVLQYLMWRREVWPQGEGVEPSQGEDQSSRARAFSKQALHHFKTLESLGEPPSRAMDTFMAIYSEVSSVYPRPHNATVCS